MCTGHAPFEAKNNELETYDKILSLDLQFPVTMSSEVVDFISRLLIKDPQARMSFAEMEEHPFMKKHENEAGRLISREIWEGWQNLRGN
jgi:serine/threonine protein kinase